MKKQTRLVSLALLASLLSASVLSCGENAETPVSGETADTFPAETEAVTEEKDPLMDDLGEFDFEGAAIRVLSCTYDPAGTFTLFDTEQNGEALNDSLYTRNREIEARFNVVFEASEKDFDPCYSTLRQNVAAGEDAYDLIMLINRNAFAAALEGMIMPTEKLTYLNPEKDYYLHDINDALTIAGKSFFYYTEESVYTFERAACLAFNKAMAARYDLADYYDLVNTGKWTQDVLYADCRAAAVDLDGNDTWNAKDQYGMTGANDYMMPSMYNLSGAVTVGKDGSDIPVFKALTDERIIGSVERLLTELNTGHGIYYNKSSSGDHTGANKMFSDGQILFLSTVVGRLFALREMEEDFGILPLPKYDEKQDKYYTRVVDAWLHVCPVTNQNPERTSVIMEALASGSARYVFPAYYEKAVQQKVLRDEQSVDMMEIIRATRIIDLGECPWYDTVRSNLEEKVLVRQTSDLMSFLTSIEGKVNQLIADAVAAVENLENQ